MLWLDFIRQSAFLSAEVVTQQLKDVLNAFDKDRARLEDAERELADEKTKNAMLAAKNKQLEVIWQFALTLLGPHVALEGCPDGATHSSGEQCGPAHDVQQR